MISEETLSQVIEKQCEIETHRNAGLPRRIDVNESTLESHALVISGVRRCGKSTLMTQRMRQNDKGWFYLKFDSPLLVDMELSDTRMLDRLIDKSGAKRLFFDEIHELKDWELYVLQKLDEGFEVCVSGSNASLLKGERATKLTGRHISKELFPFSFSEYCAYLNRPMDWTSLDGYLEQGGFPRYLTTNDSEILLELFDDILYRDVIVKNKIRDVAAVQRLVAYLIENPGCRFSASRMLKVLDVAVASTVIQWCDWIQDAYLFFFVPKYCDSVRAQLVNPRKVYCIDTGLINAVSRRIIFNDALCFENLVFLALRREFRDIYYHDEDGECDFICVAHHTPGLAVQACSELTPGNTRREVNGLVSAMRHFALKEGFIMTKSQEDEIKVDSGIIHVIPYHKFVAR